MTWPLTALGLSYMMIAEARSSFKRISIALNTDDEIINHASTENVGLKSINFTYLDEPVFFKDLNIKIKASESYLITGRTKVGKTSLINLLNGLLKPSSGSIHTPGSFVANPQIPFLFMETIDNNISTSTEAPSTQELKSISFEDEYLELPNQGQTVVGEKGTNLSGGQKQRLSLLRALKSNARCIFLDEPLSAVDENTKREITISLKNEVSKGRSLIIATSNPEHYTWIENIILISEEAPNRAKTVEVLKTKTALKEHRIQNLLRKTTELHHE